MKQTDRISSFQVTALITLNLLAASWLSLPRSAYEAAGPAAPLSTFVAGVIVIGFTYWVARLCMRFPRQTIDEFSSLLVGKLAAKLIMLLLTLYFLCIAGLEIRYFGAAVKTLLLDVTPLEVVMLTMILAAVYLIQFGINPIARFMELCLPVVVITAFFVLAVALQNFRFEELYPTFQVGVMPVIKGLPSLILAYVGFEVLFFCVAFMEKPEQAAKYAVVGVCVPVLLYTTTVIVAIGVFGGEVTPQLFATFTLARSVTFPGAFLERFDIFLAMIWILAAYTTIVVYYYMGALSLTRLCGMRNYRPVVFLLMPLVYLISITPENSPQVEAALGWVAKAGGILLFVVTLLLSVVALLRKKGVSNGAA